MYTKKVKEKGSWQVQSRYFLVSLTGMIWDIQMITIFSGKTDFTHTEAIKTFTMPRTIMIICTTSCHVCILRNIILYDYHRMSLDPLIHFNLQKVLQNYTCTVIILISIHARTQLYYFLFQAIPYLSLFYTKSFIFTYLCRTIFIVLNFRYKCT